MTLTIHTTREQCEALFPLFARYIDGEWVVPDWLSLMWLHSRPRYTVH